MLEWSDHIKADVSHPSKQCKALKTKKNCEHELYIMVSLYPSPFYHVVLFLGGNHWNIEKHMYVNVTDMDGHS